MKTILAFGDSLTWGFEAGTFRRHAFEDRWPSVLADGLGGKARIVAEGQNGRTTVHEDGTTLESRSGAVALPILLASHQPLDLAIIMLGTNDLKFAGRCRAIDAMWGMERLIEIARRFGYNENYAAPEILIVSPPHLAKTGDEEFDALFGHAIAESQAFARHYGRLAEKTGVHFFDAAAVATADPTDGVHLDALNTRAIGEALAPVVRRVLQIE